VSYKHTDTRTHTHSQHLLKEPKKKWKSKARKKQFAFSGANKQESKLAKSKANGAQNKLDKPAGL